MRNRLTMMGAFALGLLMTCGPERGTERSGGLEEPADSLPATRGFAQLVAHPPSGRLFLFGGEGKGRVPVNDMWTYDPAADRWSEIDLPSAPLDQSAAASAYDAKVDRIIAYFHTRLTRTGRGLERLSETWAYDVGAGRWTNLNPDSAPFGLMGSKMVYDAAADRMILFGGADFTQEAAPYFNETWEYDFNTNRWSRRNATRKPPGRSYFGMVYDVAARRTLIFGGSMAQADKDRAGELWAYDYAANSWEEVAFQGNAVSDHHPAMAYAPGLDKTFYVVNTSAWAFDYPSRSWAPLAYDSAMGVRHFAALAFEPQSRRLVLFGGGPRGLRYDNQTWVMDPAADRWARSREAP